MNFMKERMGKRELIGCCKVNVVILVMGTKVMGTTALAASIGEHVNINVDFFKAGI